MLKPIEDDAQRSLLQAFDRLFEKAAAKLNAEYTEEEREDARRLFTERFRDALQVINATGTANVSDGAMSEMEAALERLSPGEIAGYLAVGPIAVHLQKLLRGIAAKAAEQRLLAQLISQADDRYGGN